MPTPEKTLSLAGVRRSIGGRAFAGTTRDTVGVELEWFTTPSESPPDVATLGKMLADVELPGGSSLTFEPGGQVELSSRPLSTCSAACDAVASDSDQARGALAERGIGTFGAGSDPRRSLELRTDSPRYVAMRRYFDTYGPAGGRMMCGSSAIHVNIDAGADAEGRARWQAAHVTGPALLAAFANSPAIADGTRDGLTTGWKSSRFEAWKELDGTRTAPVAGTEDPAASWADYVLDARVMMIRQGDGCVALDGRLSFADWIEHGHALGYPDESDVAYHETTLFPPVRARGWLELRMMDMLPDPWWRAAVAVATAVITDAAARDAALDACAPTVSMWETAARCGVEHPDIALAVRGCFSAAQEALGRIGCSPALAAVVDAYVERYVAQERCPADDRSTWPAGATSHPVQEVT